jgi:hypothetical protein
MLRGLRSRDKPKDARLVELGPQAGGLGAADRISKSARQRGARAASAEAIHPLGKMPQTTKKTGNNSSAGGV